MTGEVSRLKAPPSRLVGRADQDDQADLRSTGDAVSGSDHAWCRLASCRQGSSNGQHVPGEEPGPRSLNENASDLSLRTGSVAARLPESRRLAIGASTGLAQAP